MDYVKKYVYYSDFSPVFLRKIVPMVQKKRVVDLGCGQGDYLKYFGKGSLGLDISPKNLKIAKENGLEVKRVDLNKPVRGLGVFDVVFSSHLVEHLESPFCFLKHTRVLLKKGGVLILTFPNEHSLISMKYPYFTGDGNHLYSFSMENMTELLKSSGFRVMMVYRDYYTALTRKLGLNPLLEVINYFPKPIKNYLAWSFWFVAEKK